MAIPSNKSYCYMRVGTTVAHVVMVVHLYARVAKSPPRYGLHLDHNTSVFARDIKEVFAAKKAAAILKTTEGVSSAAVASADDKVVTAQRKLTFDAWNLKKHGYSEVKLSTIVKAAAGVVILGGAAAVYSGIAIPALGISGTAAVLGNATAAGVGKATAAVVGNATAAGVGNATAAVVGNATAAVAGNATVVATLSALSVTAAASAEAYATATAANAVALSALQAASALSLTTFGVYNALLADKPLVPYESRNDAKNEYWQAFCHVLASTHF